MKRILLGALCIGAAFLQIGHAQGRANQPPPTPGPMLADGTINLDTPDFSLALVKSSQTVASLKPKTARDFDFTPGDLLVARSQNGYHHLGDLELRVRQSGSAWKSYSTSVARTPVTPLPTSTSVLAAADLAPTLPSDLPLRILRTWAVDGGRLALRFTLTNTSQQPIEIGALGIPMVFNNVLTNRTLDQAHAICSFFDPYIGEDAGYLQVTRLTGRGPALLVVPDGHTPFEAYAPILSPRDRGAAPAPFMDPTPRSVTFEGFYDWMVHSRAFADDEWKQAEPWNSPTLLTLAPGASHTYGLRFLVSDGVRSIESTLAANNRPVAVGVPGYILPTDTDARLFLEYARRVKEMNVDPAGAIDIHANAATHGWNAYTLRGKRWGRARMSVTYDDGTVQTIQYRIIKPEREVVADMGRFLTTKQWFDDPTDPFHRAPSVMTYDRETNQIVTQDQRVWIAGLSDEGGAGSWLAAMMKQLIEPDKGELEKLQRFVDETLWGRIQFTEAPREYGVRKSLFYYQPDELPAGYYRSDLNWGTWASWNKKASEATDRSFDYPHVAAAYWVMYRLARNHTSLVSNHPALWYLERAARTSIAMTQFGRGYARFGQMEGDIFLEILRDLQREQMDALAGEVEGVMRARADRWRQQAYPFGSEMPWDSTGQEEVYAWTKYFGDKEKADVTLNAVLGYMPTVPHWGYNGSARRYWDFIYGASAKYSRIERQLHHYGSGINALPVLSEYRDHPDDVYLLRVGYGGMTGVLANIDEEGFLSPAFHAFPDMLRPDPVSGDNGPNFFGHALATAVYVINHPEFGWLAFGGNIDGHDASARITPLDSARSRVYLAPAGLWLTLDAGTFESLELDTRTRKMRIALTGADEFTASARLRLEQPAAIPGVGQFHPTTPFTAERGAYVIPLSKGPTSIELNADPAPPARPR